MLTDFYGDTKHLQELLFKHFKFTQHNIMHILRLRIDVHCVIIFFYLVEVKREK